MRRTLFVVAIAGGMLSGCYTGPSAGGFGPATTPHGVASTLQLDRTTVQGELLEVSDSGYVLLAQDALVFTPYDAVNDARFAGLGSYGSGRPRAASMAKLRLMSRFPQGLSPPTLAALLAETRQSDVRVVRE